LQGNIRCKCFLEPLLQQFGDISNLKSLNKMRNSVPSTTVLAASLLSRIATAQATGPYEPTWPSTDAHNASPEWFRDAKFGVYWHWGAFTTPQFTSGMADTSTNPIVTRARSIRGAMEPPRFGDMTISSPVQTISTAALCNSIPCSLRKVERGTLRIGLLLSMLQVLDLPVPWLSTMTAFQCGIVK
jgi:hypothetical protein